MPIDDREIERILASRQRWSPPAGFIARTVARASTVRHEWPAPQPGRTDGILHLSTGALIVASLAGAVGVLVVWIVPAALPDVDAVVNGYGRFIAGTTQMMAARAVPMAWVSAALSLGFATSLVLRARG